MRWAQLGLDAGARAAVRDLYAQADLGVFSGAFTAAVGLHDVAMLRITPLSAVEAAPGWRPWHGQRAFASRPEDADLTPEREHAQHGGGAPGQPTTARLRRAGAMLRSAPYAALAPDLR